MARKITRSKEKGFIYKIYNDVNDVIYVGKTNYLNVEDRLREHKKAAPKWHDEYENSNVKHESKIYAAMCKYGVDKFHVEIIEECSLDIINEREKYWIEKCDTVNNGYNISPGGLGGPLFKGHHHSESTRDKFSEHASNRIWYSNGTDEIFIKPDEDIPDGYERCRAPKSDETIENFKISIKKHYENASPETLSEYSKKSWKTRRERGTTQTVGGMFHFNNGIIGICAKECPEGFVPGELKTEAMRLGIEKMKKTQKENREKQYREKLASINIDDMRYDYEVNGLGGGKIMKKYNLAGGMYKRILKEFNFYRETYKRPDIAERNKKMGEGKRNAKVKK